MIIWFSEVNSEFIHEFNYNVTGAQKCNHWESERKRFHSVSFWTFCSRGKQLKKLIWKLWIKIFTNSDNFFKKTLEKLSYPSMITTKYKKSVFNIQLGEWSG